MEETRCLEKMGIPKDPYQLGDPPATDQSQVTTGLLKLAVIRPGRAVVLVHAERHTSNAFCVTVELQKESKMRLKC
jgi:hypothetical protein